MLYGGSFTELHSWFQLKSFNGEIVQIVIHLPIKQNFDNIPGPEKCVVKNHVFGEQHEIIMMLILVRYFQILIKITS